MFRINNNYIQHGELVHVQNPSEHSKREMVGSRGWTLKMTGDQGGGKESTRARGGENGQDPICADPNPQG